MVVDATDPVALASFWADLLGWDLEEEDGFAGATGKGTVRRLEFVPTTEKKTTKNWMHFDLSSASVDDQRDTVRRAIELGASKIDVGQGTDATHSVLADPEGNEFCVLEPENNFVDRTGRLGSLTCDGSVAVGHFWSSVLGWPLVWDRDDETAIRSPEGTGPFITFGPPVVPKRTKNRLHIDVAGYAGDDQGAEVQRIESLGARRVDIGQGDVPWIVLADPDGNEFCVLTSRD